MPPAGEIKLILRGTTDLKGVEEYKNLLISCNTSDWITPSATDTSFALKRFTIATDTFDLGSLELLNNGTTLRFGSVHMQVEITGRNIKQLDDKRFCAIYGELYDEEDLVRVADADAENIAASLLAIRGTFSIIYVCFRSKTLYITKDELGIKSLLISFSDDDILISNRATTMDRHWYEIPPFLLTTFGEEVATIQRPSFWAFRICQLQRLTNDAITEQVVESAIARVRAALSNSIKDICRRRSFKDCVTILFSGGLDSALIASMVAENVEDLQYIELVNVAFQPKRAPDRITAMCTYEDLVQIYPRVNFRLVCVDVDTDEYKTLEPWLYRLIMPNTTHMDMNIAAAIHYAVKLEGHILDPQILKTEEWDKLKHNTSIMKSVNLRVTIAKPHRGTYNHKEKNETNIFVESLGEENLRRSASDDDADILLRHWDNLQRTGNTYFNSTSSGTYQSQSKDVLIGSGADEIFGGYGRHAVERNKNASISEHEVNKDLLRLWKRNMGRDDRVVNESGITARYPFLHEILLDTLTELNINPSICINALSCPEWFKALGIHKLMRYEQLKYCEFLKGDRNMSVSVYINKWLLREIALRSGLKHCAHFKKRAIQFGSRSAKTFNMLRGMSNRVASDKGSAALRKEDMKV